VVSLNEHPVVVVQLLNVQLIHCQHNLHVAFQILPIVLQPDFQRVIVLSIIHLPTSTAF
jgi:hypothetical protein